MPTETNPKSLKNILVAGSAVLALGAGFTILPSVLAQPSQARPIVIQPPAGAPMSFADLIDRVSPAVVSIRTTTRVTANQDEPNIEDLPPELRDQFRRFFGERGENGGRGRRAESLGSGFFISGDGLVVTNNHVIEGASEIMLTLSNGREVRATLVGADKASDLAVLRAAPGAAYPFVSLDRENDLRVGDWVVAVGNPFGLSGSATAGIVSAKGRDEIGDNAASVDFIQIDAPINRGNSGGPAFDLSGRVVGVNSAIISPTGGSVGIGFAIPSQVAARVVDQLVRNGRVTRGWLGVIVQPMDTDLARAQGLSDRQGALVAELIPGAPAERAGVREGDVVLSVNGAPVKDQRDLTRQVGSLEVGSRARFEILRDGQRRTLEVVMAERPSEEQLASNGNNRRPDPPGAQQTPQVQQGAFGLGVRPITPADRSKYNIASDTEGLVVLSVDEESEAAEKLAEGDVILQAGDRPARTMADLDAAISAAKESGRDAVRLRVQSSDGRGNTARRWIALDATSGQG
jgi:serine protease Do